MTNNAEQDRDVNLYSDYTRMFDSDGSEYRVDKIIFGNQEYSHFSSVKKHLIMGIPTKVVFKFGKVSSKVSYIPAIEFEVRIDDRNIFRFKFRNIPLSRQ